MNIFYARCLLFQTRLCFNFNELNNTPKFKFMKQKENLLPSANVKFIRKKRGVFMRLEPIKEVQLNYSEKTCEVSLIS